jgi:peptidoglycan/LPS O-acetylase OafA/YrhL
MKFRPDIEGLRALAIVPVVVYHAWPSALPGGFVGVDVFFVISGYLITLLLLQRLQAGSYSVAGFYAARIRRIFPALFVMLALTLPLAMLMLSPQALQEHARLLGATSLFLSNIELHRTTDYFGTAADLKPLLHTWSLAVEEQYYIVFPLLLAALWRWAKPLLPWALAGIGLASLAYSQWLLRWEGSLAFYSALSRTFELMVGSWLAWRMSQEATGRLQAAALPWRRGMAWLGLAAVLASFALLRSDLPFPGAAALLPCLGTALLIYSGSQGDTELSRALSWQPLRWIGGLSFSLYLWHWPALVFSRHWLLDHPTALQAGVAVLASVGLAWASLRWVEAPVREAKGLKQSHLLVAGALSIALGLGAAWAVHGYAVQQGEAAPQSELLKGALDISPARADCHNLGSARRCAWGGSNDAKEVVVWGDSHAVELAYALGEVVAPGWRVGQRSTAACPPTAGFSLPTRKICLTHQPEVLDRLIWDASVTHVVLVMRFDSYLGPDDAASFSSALDRTVQALRKAGKQVMLLDPIPTYGYSIPDALAQRQLRGWPLEEQGQLRSDYELRQAGGLSLAAQLASAHGAMRLSVAERLCEAARCQVLDAAGRPLYFDDNHLSLTGARQLVPPIKAWLQAAPAQTR